ncbi:MAG: hypothetical protein HY240_04950 [Actinobacteria bacterium]|nr:hypothetical protein [Actinomycetota bacterium]
MQTLLGAWLYLLPMSRPGHPEERRGALAATELAWPLQLAALNLGLVLMTARAAGWASDRVGLAGTALALFGGGLALAKAWLFGVLGRVEAIADRGRRAWGAWGA